MNSLSKIFGQHKVQSVCVCAATELLDTGSKIFTLRVCVKGCEPRYKIVKLRVHFVMKRGGPTLLFL